jgi:CubicO group peptidase (beta-lactamase class C family)
VIPTLRKRLGVLALLPLALGAPLRAQEPASRFPQVAPADVGLDPARLEELAAFVRDLTERDEVVGAELLLIRNDKTVLHRAFGWKDREAKIAMEPDTIFCVRSMTKPVAGTAIEILLDEKKLSLSDKVSEHLPSFDNDRSRAITVEMLLHHRGGLPLSGLMGKDVSKITGLAEVADAVGEKGPEHPPGTEFSYSDDGADTLGRLVEVLSGERFDAFVQKRILDPLQMQDAIPVVALDHPKRPRIASDYAGAPRSWTKFWSPKDPPIFPVLLASQSLYCTPVDYAKFLALWKDKGTADGRRLVSRRAVRRALTPGVDMGYPTGFAGLGVDYGEMWMLYVDRSKPDDPRVVAFGHNGSDGTFAYCFPELDLLALYFTQARGTLSGVAFEEALQKHVVDPLLRTERAPAEVYTEAELDSFGGEYWNDEHRKLCALLRRGAAPWIEFPGQGIVQLKPTPVRDRFTIALAPSESFDVERDEKGAGRAVVAHSKAPGGEVVTIRFERLVPAPGLPSSDEIEALRKRAVDWDKIAGLGTCRFRGTIDMPARKLSGAFETLAQGTTRFRTEIDLKTIQVKVALDGDRAWTQNSTAPVQELSGVTLEQTRLDHPLRRIADWSEWFPTLRVLREVEIKGRKAFLLRGQPKGSGPRSLYVDAETGLLLAEGFVPTVPGLGEIGVWIDYDDWREVAGVKLPFQVAVEYASPLLGTATSKYETIEANVEAPAGAFRLESAKPEGKSGGK